MTAIVIDIETIPSQQPGARAQVRQTIKPPGTLKKPESIAAWWDTEATAAVESEYRKQALDDGLHGEIISIAIAAPNLDEDIGWSYCRAMGESEALLLSLFADAVTARIDRAAAGLTDGFNYAQDPYFIAHNAAFDLPYYLAPLPSQWGSPTVQVPHPQRTGRQGLRMHHAGLGWLWWSCQPRRAVPCAGDTQPQGWGH